MYEELRKKAKKKVEAKMSLYICAIVFTFVSAVLLMISVYLPSISFWLRLPIPIFVMILSILYVTIYGIPYTDTHGEDWQEEEVQKEMFRLYQKRKAYLKESEDLSETEMLELKELEEIEETIDRDEDYV